jgi:hypothetical protein
VPDTFTFLSLDEFKRLSPSAKQAYLEKLHRYLEAAELAAKQPPPAPKPPVKRTPV